MGYKNRSYLPNKICASKAYQTLAAGGHPSAFCAAMRISLDEHFEKLRAEEDYRVDFLRAMTQCIAYWQNVATEALGGSISTTDNVTALGYHAGATMEKAIPRKLNVALWQHRIQDLERYMPSLVRIEEDAPQVKPELKPIELKKVTNGMGN